MRALLALLLAVTACDASVPAPVPTEPPRVGQAPEPVDPGLVEVDSPHDVATTTARLQAAARAAGLTVFATVDHAANAEGAGLELPPTRVVLVGKPQVGTRLMTCARSHALDLPQRVLVTARDGGSRLVWNDPAWLATRHGLGDCGGVPDKVAEVLRGLATTVASTDALDTDAG